MTSLLFTLLSTGLTVGVFAYLFSYIELSDLLLLIKELHLPSLATFVLLSLAGSMFRTWRYAILLHTRAVEVSKPALFLIVLVRNLCSDLLPARLGSTVYIYLVHSHLGIALTSASTSFACALFFDVVAILPLILLVLTFQFSQEFIVLLSVASILFLLVLAGLYFLPQLLQQVDRLITNLRVRTSNRYDSLLEKLHSFFNAVREETLDYRARGLFAPLFCLSIGVRLCKYFSLYIFLVALLIPLGYGTESIPFGKALIAIFSAEAGASLPISGIAGFGAYEGLWVGVLQLLGIPSRLAQITGVSHHLFTQVYGYSLGALAMGALLIWKWSGYSRNSSTKQEPHNRATGMRFTLAYSCALAMTAATASAPLLYASSVDHTKVRAKLSSYTNEQIETIKAFGKLFPGTIVYDSNISGSFGIHAIDVSSGHTIALIDTAEHEMFPAISSDGRQIAYARTKSLARIAPADIWLYDTEKKTNQKLIENATFPTFSKDGKTIYFERERKYAFSFSLANKEIKEIFPAGHPQFVGRRVVKPKVSLDGSQIAFTSDTPSRWHAWKASLHGGTATRLGAGCEPSFRADNVNTIFIQRGKAKGGSGIFSASTTTAPIPLHDWEGELGHEYFPQILENDRLLLFAAAPEDTHSHTEAPYQVLAKDTVTSKTYQLTYNEATNRWPQYSSKLTLGTRRR